MLTSQIADQLVAGMGMVQASTREVDAAQSVGTVQIDGINLVLDGRSSAQAGPAWRINLLYECLHVARSLVGGNIARRGGKSKHLQFRIVECHGNGEGAIQTGIRHQDELA